MIFLLPKIKKSKSVPACDFERCVVCGKMTDIPKDLPVSERKTYMEGAGQLCRECCIELYHTDDLRDI